MDIGGFRKETTLLHNRCRGEECWEKFERAIYEVVRADESGCAVKRLRAENCSEISSAVMRPLVWIESVKAGM